MACFSSNFIFRSFILYLCFTALLQVSHKASAQYTPVHFQPGDDYLRTAQLQGEIGGEYSLSIRPISQPFILDSLTQVIPENADKKIRYRLLPVAGTFRYNTTRPFGWNDAGMRMTSGFQQQWSAGVYGRLGPMELQLQPEWVQVADPLYKNTPAYGATMSQPLRRFYPGQSSLQVNIWPITFGVSTRNLWWGPAQFSALLMSNHAPGFPHAYFQSRRPLRTPIGHFEWQLIGAVLSEDSSRAMENAALRPLALTSDKRYLSAFVLSYRPRWLKGIYLGAIRSEQAYVRDIDASNATFFKKYLSVLSLPSPVDNFNQVGIPSDGLVSFFLRWRMEKAKAELYTEFGYNDFKQNLRDLAVNPGHAAAYTLGFKKVIEQNKILWDLSAELTRMSQSNSYLLRNAGNWYTHGRPAQGYTHQNQVLGGGSGLGNNLQTLQLLRRKDFNYWGIRLQRMQQDPKGLGGSFENLGMRTHAWTDWVAGILFQQRYRQFFTKGEILAVQARNFGWTEPDRFNLFAQIQIGYLW